MIQGFYRIAYTGNHGSGLGILVLRAGIIAGADVAGATYDGTYRLIESKDSLMINVTMRAPAGSTPVQTGLPIAAPMTLPMRLAISADLGNGTPVLIETAIGRVNVIFSKICNLGE